MSTPQANLPRILLLGRPNVGKSSLFNALLGYRRAIVLDMPGTTVDFIWEKFSWDDETTRHEISLADTQGILEQSDLKKIEEAARSVDGVLWVLDANSGILPDDKDIAGVLRKLTVPVLVVANKMDAASDAAENLMQLGFKEMIRTSAAHRRGLDDMKAWLEKFSVKTPLAEIKERGAEKPSLKLAILGKPNSGKSTLVNRLVGRAISEVSPRALTTRDPVAAEIEFEGTRIKILDTAGLRRPRSKMTEVEKFSVHATTRTVTSADVVLLMIAAHEPVSDQDMRLLNLLQREGKPCVILLNFWDMLDQTQRRIFLKDSEFATYLEDFKVVPISAKTGFEVESILPLVVKLQEKSHHRVKTAKLNEIVSQMIAENPPPTGGKYHFNILYASQVEVNPPTFVFFAKRAYQVSDSYRRYLEKRLRDRLGYKSQAVKLVFRNAGKRLEDVPRH